MNRARNDGDIEITRFALEVLGTLREMVSGMFRDCFLRWCSFCLCRFLVI